MRFSRCLGVITLAFSTHAAAINCPAPDNLVANCGFDLGIAGYQAQAGDVVGHDPELGSTAPGAMIVIDTLGDADSQAEAELCVDLAAQTSYRIGADILGEDADQCFLGWDEYLQPGCVQTNGVFSPTDMVPVNAANFITLDGVLRSSAEVQSAELVIVCEGDGSVPTRFVVDDVFVLPGPVFVDGFESD